MAQNAHIIGMLSLGDFAALHVDGAAIARALAEISRPLRVPQLALAT